MIKKYVYLSSDGLYTFTLEVDIDPIIEIFIQYDVVTAKGKLTKLVNNVIDLDKTHTLKNQIVSYFYDLILGAVRRQLLLIGVDLYAIDRRYD